MEEMQDPARGRFLCEALSNRPTADSDASRAILLVENVSNGGMHPITRPNPQVDGDVNEDELGYYI